MSSQYTIQDIKPSKKQVVISVIDPEILKKAESRVIQKLSQELKLKGFRPGKIPENIVRETVERSFIEQRSIEEAIPFVLQEIGVQHALKMISRPEVKLESFAPLKIEASWDVYPEAKVGDLSKIAMKKKKVEVKEEEVNAAISHLQKIFQNTEKLDKPPEITEALIEKITGKKDTVEAWKASVKESILQEKDLEAKRVFDDEFYKKLIELTTVELPVSLVSEEQQGIMREVKQNILRYGLSFEHYLSTLKKNEEELLKSFETQANERVTLRLALETIAKQEKIEVSDLEIEERLKEFQKEAPDDQKKKIKAVYQEGSQGHQMLRYQMMMQKTLEKIMPKA